MSQNCIIEHAVHKSQAFEVLMSYSSEYHHDLEEEVSPIEVQAIERNFLKLFGILL